MPIEKARQIHKETKGRQSQCLTMPAKSRAGVQPASFLSFGLLTEMMEEQKEYYKREDMVMAYGTLD